MPFKLIDVDCSPLLIDYEYEITDKNLLAEYVGEMVLGHHNHIRRIINSLSTTSPLRSNASIDSVISQLKTATVEKRDGWLFQMVSWVVLAKRNQGNKFHSNYPQFAPAQHGIDGLAVVLNDDNSLKSIVITEDKCTTSPRGKITQQVFPEFQAFEEAKKDNALVGIISTLLENLDAGKVLDQVQNNIFESQHRIYRIGITREEEHNADEGRKKLFLNYDVFVPDEKPHRRTAASIYIQNLRDWMEDFAKNVIAYLESKKS